MVFALCFFFLRHTPYNLRGDNPAFYLLQGPFSNSACFVLRRLPLPPKREVSTSHYRKNCLLCIMPYFAPLWTSLDHLCIHHVHIVYITALFPFCILSVTIFPISTIFSPSFFGFSSAIFFSISIYCGFTFFYHYAALVVPFCTWLCFFRFSFALLM